MTTALAPRPTSLVTVGNRSVSVRGWTVNGAVDHLHIHLTKSKKWCEINCLANTMFGRATAANVRKARARKSDLFKALLTTRGELLMTEYGADGKILAVKVWEGKPEEVQVAAMQANRALKRKEVDEATYQTILAILGVTNGANGAD